MKFARILLSILILLALAIIASCATDQATPLATETVAAGNTITTSTLPTIIQMTETPTPLLLNATISEVSGGVEVKQPAQTDFTSAAPPELLRLNGQVRTLDDGRARLDLSTGTIVRVAPSSLFMLEINQPQDESLFTRIKLTIGQIFILLSGGSLEVDTPSGQASVRGSYMMVEILPDTSDVLVTCLEGFCRVENASGFIELVSGQAATLFNPDNYDGQLLPPLLTLMTETDFELWDAEFPDLLKTLWTDVSATLTAMPPLPTRDLILLDITPTLPGILPTLVNSLPEPTLPGILPTVERTPILPRP